MALLRHGRPATRQPGSVRRRAALIVVLVSWAFLLEPIGFLTTSIAAYCALLVIANYDRWTPRMAVTYGAVGALVLGSLYSIFFLALDVPLPQGMLR
jgi:putative tricarboxylic transport membrane protein